MTYEVIKNRNISIDILKGIGIILVIVGHYWHPANVATIIWSFHMPLFVIVSGLFLKEFSMCRFKKNMVSLLVPYIITCFIQFVLNAIKTKFFFSGGSINIFLGLFLPILLGQGVEEQVMIGENYITVESVYVVWFLLALFEGQLISGLLLKFIDKKWIRFAISFIIVALSLWLYNVGFMWGNIQGGAAFAFWLLIGNSLKEYGIFDKTTWIHYMAPVIWFVIVLIEITSNNPMNICDVHLFQIMYWVKILGAVCGTITVCCFARLLARCFLANSLSFVGRISKIIMCLHSIDLACFSGIWKFIMRTIRLESSFVLMLFRLVAAVGGAFVFEAISKRVKLKSKLSR